MKTMVPASGLRALNVKASSVGPCTVVKAYSVLAVGIIIKPVL